MQFRFIHAADLHIDSPLASLGVKDPAVAARFARANRAAVEGLVSETIASEATFLIIAGDIFDGDWKDVSTGLFFARALGELHRAGVPTFIVKGNHDAESVDVARPSPIPTRPSSSPPPRPTRKRLRPLRVALHGRSFAARGGSRRFPSRAIRRGARAGSTSACCTPPSTARAATKPMRPARSRTSGAFGYDYWALGHIHAAEIVSRDPWIVFPGNLAGALAFARPARRARCASRSRTAASSTSNPSRLDAARWAHESVDVSACAETRPDACR